MAENRVSRLDEEESKCTRWRGVEKDGTQQRWVESHEATMNRLRHEYATTQEEVAQFSPKSSTFRRKSMTHKSFNFSSIKI